MGRAETLSAARERFPQYNDMSDDALASALASNYPAYRDLVPAKQDNRSIVGGALADTFGLSDRPGRVGVTSNEPGAKTPLGVILKPANWQEQVVREMVLAPVTYAGGAGLGAVARGAGLTGKVASYAAPAVGRVATSAGIGAATAGAQGADIPTTALLDAVLAAGTEGLGGVVDWRLAKRAAPLVKERAEAVAQQAGRTKAFEHATTAVDTAWDAVKNRVLGAKVMIPSLSSTKIDLADAVQMLKDKAVTGPKYQQALAEVKHWMDRLDKQRLAGGPKPWAGREFTRRASAERYIAPQVPIPEGTTFQRVADKVLAAPSVGRAAVEAGTSAPVEPVGGLPAGLLAAMMVPGVRPVARHIPGAREVVEAVEEAE